MTACDPLMKPVVRSAIQALRLPPGSQGLDAGCGIGLQALSLAEAVGSSGHVAGLDIHSDFLLHAEEIVKTSGMSEQISFQQGDVYKLPFTDCAFDWVWSSNCVGYSASIRPLPALRELARVVRPGGTVAVLVWSSEKLLNGYPLLEARLNATSSGIAPFESVKKPESHFLRALGWFRDAGLVEATVQTFAGDAHAPLTDDLRDALIALIEMRWPGVKSELTQVEWSEYRRLCLPDSPEFILDRSDYYAFFTCSMFRGKVARD
jgi:ubiquinone/menaquinone biosynthesis C-methylase UbiE